MTKGKRPTAPPPSPWGRWVVVLGGLVAVALVVWLIARSSADDGADEPAPIADPAAPQPLSGSDGPTVQAAASLENVPPDSLVSAGPDAPSGVDVSNDPPPG